MALIAIIDYDMGNLRNVERALIYTGAEARSVRSPSEAADAAGVVLPGVGNFHDAMKNLDRAGFVPFLRDWTAADKPFLGICLGLQMLFESSEEAPGVPGLGILKGCCRKFVSDTEKVPHMGWNTVSFSSAHPCFASFKEPAWFYFVHSFYLRDADSDIVAGTCEYGVEIECAVQKGRVAATQFHPEKSGEIGLKLLKNFVEG